MALWQDTLAKMMQFAYFTPHFIGVLNDRQLPKEGHGPGIREDISPATVLGAIHPLAEHQRDW